MTVKEFKLFIVNVPDDFEVVTWNGEYEYGDFNELDEDGIIIDTDEKKVVI